MSGNYNCRILADALHTGFNARSEDPFQQRLKDATNKMQSAGHPSGFEWKKRRKKSPDSRETRSRGACPEKERLSFHTNITPGFGLAEPLQRKRNTGDIVVPAA